MEQKITVSQAAKQLGVTRADLNKRLSAAGIEAFEGKVNFEKVQCIAPTLGRGNTMLERIKVLRENTISSVKVDHARMNEKDLESQIHKLSTELMVESSLNHRYETIFQELAKKLGEAQISSDGDTRELAFDICGWLRSQISTA
ncbi:MAG: hypothetical protein OEW37_06790 [Rhodospirillaceae bacterium]|nr:hypothetical protein [Rhodospirillaceae bacterium]